MCLSVKNKKVLTAEKDIVGYKIVLERNVPAYVSSTGSDFNSLHTYFQCFPVKLGKLYHKNGDKFRFYKDYEGEFRVEDGGFHIFTDVHDALGFFDGKVFDKSSLLKREGADYSPLGYSRAKIVKAIVPKGTKYVSGSFTYSGVRYENGKTYPYRTVCNSICAKSVIYKEYDEE